MDAMEHALSNFDQFSVAAAFLDLSAEQLIELLKDDRLISRSEDHVCSAAMRWLHQQQTDRSRRNSLFPILSAIRLTQCSGEFLVKLRKDVLVCKHEQSWQLVSGAIHQLLVFLSSKAPALKPEEGRRAQYDLSTIFVFGVYDRGALDTVEKFDPATNSFSYVAPMPTKRYGCGAAAINGRQILVIGGCGGDKKQTPTALVESYDPINDNWRSLMPMPTARLNLGVAGLDGHVYAVGGQLAGKEVTAVVERYDPASNSWSTVTPMNGVRSECAAVAVNGRLYVLGGTAAATAGSDVGPVPMVSVDCFDPATGVWSSSSPPMPEARQGFGCAVFGGRIFVAGGWRTQVPGRPSALRSVVIFNPVTQTWSDGGQLTDFTTGRSELSLAAVGGRLLAIGGWEFGDAQDFVDEYDPVTNSWRQLDEDEPHQLNGDRQAHCAAVV